MSRIKKILIGILIVFIVIQFIQPARNKNGQVLATDKSVANKTANYEKDYSNNPVMLFLVNFPGTATNQ